MHPPSFWLAQCPPPPQRPPLPGPIRADVAIVGAGYTGLWTAYHLRRAAPDLRVVVIEREFAGFGASGRNGGWLTGGMAWDPARMAARHGDGATRAFIAALRDTVPAVIAAARAEGIEAEIRETEELTVATHAPGLARLRAEAVARQGWGEAVRMLDTAETAARLRIPGALGALALPGVARVQPAKLVVGLAAAVERLGVAIHEGTTALRLMPGRVETNRGTVEAPIVLQATEGFSAGLPGTRRRWLPLNSAQVVTVRLPEAVWARIGWAGAELVGTAEHLYAYGTRTPDGRIALGGRGLPYIYGSRIDAAGRTDPVTEARLRAMLARIFPDAAACGIETSWCGVLGAPRDWVPSVGLDRATGLGWAGGYVGVGVATAHLAGRTLADLALGRETAMTRLPWVNRRAPDWEPEPWRWLGVRGMYALYEMADRHEARSGRPSGLAAWANRLTGR
jgi:glycine/D-amino acid oxidase-like deaminating enzyme